MEKKEKIPVSSQKGRDEKNSLSYEKQKPKKTDIGKIAIIRISGMVKVSKDIENTLYRLRLRRKYSCVVVNPTKDILGMLKKIRFYIAYGEIDKETYDELVKQRGKKVNNKLKPFFRLHPPRKGIKSKLQYPKGVLGNNKADINKLIKRML